MCLSSTKFPQLPPAAPPPPPLPEEEEEIRILPAEALIARDKLRGNKSLLSSLKIPLRRFDT